MCTNGHITTFMGGMDAVFVIYQDTYNMSTQTSSLQ